MLHSKLEKSPGYKARPYVKKEKPTKMNKTTDYQIMLKFFHMQIQQFTHFKCE